MAFNPNFGGAKPQAAPAPVKSPAPAPVASKPMAPPLAPPANSPESDFKRRLIARIESTEALLAMLKAELDNLIEREKPATYFEDNPFADFED